MMHNERSQHSGSEDAPLLRHDLQKHFGKRSIDRLRRKGRFKMQFWRILPMYDVAYECRNSRRESGVLS